MALLDPGPALGFVFVVPPHSAFLMNVPPPAPPSFFIRCQLFFLAVLIFYWLALVLVLPVTTGDAHTYNLARLAITEREGFFSANAWNFEPQIALPWAFDAVHYAFLQSGFGYSLPSYLAFLGILIVVFQMAKAVYGLKTALWCCLIPFSMPTIMFQASTTKNDMVLAFCLAVWIYAMWRWRQEKAFRHIFLAALALAFAVGSKTSGLLLFLPCLIWTLYELKNHRRCLRFSMAAALAGLLLFGSPETGYRSWKMYGHPLGPSSIRSDHANRDGWQGGTANLVRYLFGSANFQWASMFTIVPSTGTENFCRAVLQKIGLENKGYRPDFNDGSLRFLRNGWESFSDYGPVGFLALLLSLVILAKSPLRSPPFFLALIGWTWLLLISGTVAWMPWNNRFLLISFFCFAFSAIFFLSGSRLQSRRLQNGALIVLLGYAFLCPIGSYNRHPGMLSASVTKRTEVMTMENPVIQTVLEDLRSSFASAPQATVILCPGPDSWVLPFYLDSRWRVYNRPALTPEEFGVLCSKNRPAALVVLDQRSRFPAEKFAVTPVASYPLRTTALYIPNPQP
jgi:4-amino-4-deoxy-L-arabinose transferase-like glycosyltransferase